MVSAIAEYPVKINDGVIIFAESASYPKIVARANNTAVTEDTIRENGLQNDKAFVPGLVKTTLSGLANGANIAYFVKEGLIPFPGGSPSIAPALNLYPFQHITNYAAMYAHECAPAWKDPRDEIMAAMNEIMFRTGIYTAQHYNKSYLEPLIDPGQEIYYDVAGTPTSEVEVFHSDFRWFAGAAAVQMFCILVISLTFYGWWRLGRSTTFSPLEIAKVSAWLLLLAPT